MELSLSQKIKGFTPFALFVLLIGSAVPSGYAEVVVSPAETQDNGQPVITAEESEASAQPSPSPQASDSLSDNPLTAATTPEADLNASPAPSPSPSASAQSHPSASTIPGKPTLGTFADKGTVTTSQSSSSEFTMNYNFESDESFGGGILFLNPEQDLSGLTEIAFDARFASGGCQAGGDSCMKFEIVDAQNNVAALAVPSVTSDFSTLRFTKEQILAANPDLNLAAIKQINFVLEARNLEPNTGAIDIGIKGLAFTPVVTAAAPAVTPAALPGTYSIISFENQSTGTVQTVSDSQFLYNYDLSTAGSFAGPIINYGGEAGTGSQDFSTVDGFAFNLRTNNACTGSKCLKIEFQDSLNNLAVVEVQGLTDAFQAVNIPAATLLAANANLNLASIKQINFVLEEGSVTPKQGFLEVQTGAAGTANPSPNPSPTASPSPSPSGSPSPSPSGSPSPGASPSPNPSPSAGSGLLTGLEEGATVSGTIQVQPNAEILPRVKKTAFYLNGTKAGRSYEEPYIWGGSSGFDTSKLADGTYTLSGVVTTDEGDQEFSITFTVNNGNTSSPELDPQQAGAEDFTGLEENQNVTGTITIRPDLTANPGIHKVFYYLDDELVEKVYESPFEITIDASELEDGTHTLSGLFTVIAEDDATAVSLDHVFSINFTTGSGQVTGASVSESNAAQPADDPAFDALEPITDADRQAAADTNAQATDDLSQDLNTDTTAELGTESTQPAGETGTPGVAAATAV